MFFVTSAHPLQGTRLVAVWVVRYTVVTGLRLQGINVFSVVVQVGEGTFLALLYLRSDGTILVRVEEHSRSHTEPQSCCGYREEMHDVYVVRGSNDVLVKGCIDELNSKRWRQGQVSQDRGRESICK